jgi:hypothetical protein
MIVLIVPSSSPNVHFLPLSRRFKANLGCYSVNPLTPRHIVQTSSNQPQQTVAGISLTFLSYPFKQLFCITQIPTQPITLISI